MTPVSPTSYEAWLAVQPKVGTQRAKVLRYILERGLDGATDEECQRDLAMNPSTQRPRRGELHRAGLLEDAKRTRMTSGKRAATVWVYVPRRVWEARLAPTQKELF